MLDLIEKIKGLTLYGFYDPAKDMIMIHFFNKDEEKADIVAYLKRNMSWDVREVIGEKAILTADKEIIEVQHRALDTYAAGSAFDTFVRKALTNMVAEKEKPLREVNKMFRILEDGQYDD